MVCYMCGAGASFTCPCCQRTVCSNHTGYYDPERFTLDRPRQGSYYCQTCKESFDEKAAKEFQRSCWCDFCNKATLSRDATPKCAKCGKRFCWKHGQKIDAEQRWSSHYGAWEHGYWIRCNGHLPTGKKSFWTSKTIIDEQYDGTEVS